MSHRWRSWIVRAEALICTGMPGLYRVLVFASVQHVYSLVDLGHTASAMSLAQLAGFFTAIGWASLILVRVPTATDRRQAVDAFYTIAWMAGLCIVVMSSIALIVAAVVPITFDGFAFVLLLCGWSVYQVARHYFVARKSYRVAVLFDLILISVSHAALHGCRARGLSSSTALALSLLITSLAMFATIGAPSYAVLRHRFETKGLQFGMTNFLSGGINLVFVPIASLTCGVAFAGGFSLLSSITAVAILLPRAISTTQLPELAKLTASRMPIESAIRTMNRNVWQSNVGVLAANVVIVIVAVYCGARGIQVDHRGALIVAGLLLATQYAVAMGSAVPSSVMMVFERASETAGINMKATLVFTIPCGLAFLFSGPSSFFMILVAAIATSILRNGLVATQARRAVQAYSAITVVMP